MTEVPSSVKDLIPSHEALAYLQNIPDLTTEQIQEIVYFSNKLGSKILSECFLAVHQMMATTLNPEHYSKVIDDVNAYKLKLYDDFQTRIETQGKKREEITEDDILVGDINLEWAKMSRDTYVASLAKQKKIWLESKSEIAQLFQKLIASTREKLQEDEEKRFLDLMELQHGDADEVRVREHDREMAQGLEQKFQKIGRRLSPAWRREVLLNPWIDTELAKEMREHGEKPDPEMEKVFKLLAEGMKVKRAIEKIRAETIDAALLGEYVEGILSLVTDLNPFTERKLRNLQAKTPLPFQEIADLLEQAYSLSKIEPFS